MSNSIQLSFFRFFELFFAPFRYFSAPPILLATEVGGYRRSGNIRAFRSVRVPFPVGNTNIVPFVPVFDKNPALQNIPVQRHNKFF